jgi:hypothetical protein
MIAIDAAAGERRGRAFLRDLGLPIEPVLEAFRRRYLDDDDRPRERLLREALLQAVVRGTAHPGADPKDLAHVYLSHPDAAVGLLFACVVISAERLAAMLDEAPVVLETFCLQLAPGAHFTKAALHAAVEVWAARNFPDVATPRFEIEPWLGDADADLLDLLLEEPRHEGGRDFPGETRPGEAMAKPPYVEAA